MTPPAPVVEAPPPAKKVELSADASFGFDSTMLRPTVRASLDKLVNECLAPNRRTTITIHAG